MHLLWRRGSTSNGRECTHAVCKTIGKSGSTTRGKSCYLEKGVHLSWKMGSMWVCALISNAAFRARLH